MFSVYQHWDPLKVCVVGRSYPPEFYSWITVPHVRSLFEKIAIETEEDYQNIINKLESFGVEVLRTNLLADPLRNGQYVPPPMSPRDYSVMIGTDFYVPNGDVNGKLRLFYNNVKDAAWPKCSTIDDFYNLPEAIQRECLEVHNFKEHVFNSDPLADVVAHVKQQGNQVKDYFNGRVTGAMSTRLGRDLYFGTLSYTEDVTDFEQTINQEFTQTRNHIINTGGHSDGTFCPVCPGLIISLTDIPSFDDTFPGWEVVYLPGQSWEAVQPFLDLKHKNQGKWWIPGFEHDNAVTDTVETWLNHWVGYVEETVFDLNMLIVDPKNVLVFNYNKLVFDALERYGITPHIVPFRHRYLWDGGIHCVTSDLHRVGTMQDYFPERG